MSYVSCVCRWSVPFDTDNQRRRGKRDPRRHGCRVGDVNQARCTDTALQPCARPCQRNDKRLTSTTLCTYRDLHQARRIIIATALTTTSTTTAVATSPFGLSSSRRHRGRREPLHAQVSGFVVTCSYLVEIGARWRPAAVPSYRRWPSIRRRHPCFCPASFNHTLCHGVCLPRNCAFDGSNLPPEHEGEAVNSRIAELSANVASPLGVVRPGSGSSSSDKQTPTGAHTTSPSTALALLNYLSLNLRGRHTDPPTIVPPPLLKHSFLSSFSAPHAAAGVPSRAPQPVPAIVQPPRYQSPWAGTCIARTFLYAQTPAHVRTRASIQHSAVEPCSTRYTRAHTIDGRHHPTCLPHTHTQQPRPQFDR